MTHSVIISGFVCVDEESDELNAAQICRWTTSSFARKSLKSLAFVKVDVFEIHFVRISAIREGRGMLRGMGVYQLEAGVNLKTE